MAHSYSSLGIQKLLMNGKPVGEIETRTALAGWFDTPVIFLSGDQAAAAQLHDIDPDAETAVVKEGIDNYTCISLSAEAASRLIHEHAAAAMHIAVVASSLPSFSLNELAFRPQKPRWYPWFPCGSSKWAIQKDFFPATGARGANNARRRDWCHFDQN